MIRHLLRYVLTLGVVLLASCDLDDLDGPKPPRYTHTTNPPYDIVLDTTNLVPNGDFEDGISDWSVWAIEGGQADFIRSTDAHTGQYSLRAHVRQLGINTWSINAIRGPILINNDQRYLVSLCVKSGGQGERLNVKVTLDHDPWWEYLSQSCNPTTEWEEYSFEFNAPDYAEDGSHFVLNFLKLGVFWIDDVKIQQYVQVDL